MSKTQKIAVGNAKKKWLPTHQAEKIAMDDKRKNSDYYPIETSIFFGSKVDTKSLSSSMGPVAKTVPSITLNNIVNM